MTHFETGESGEEDVFEVKFLVRLKAAAQQQVWPPVSLYPAREQARLTNQQAFKERVNTWQFQQPRCVRG
jgi:hypothetical protein